MFKCPSCENEFEKTKPGGICPICKAKLSKSGDIYVLRDIKPEDKETKYELLYWDGIIRLEKHKTEDKFIMNFHSITPNSWIRCPQCKAKLFQNQTMNGSLDIKCKRCKSITTYIFQ